MNLKDLALRLENVELMLDRTTKNPVKYWIDIMEVLRDSENHKSDRYLLMFVMLSLLLDWVN